MKKITSKISTATLIFICIFCFSQCHKNSNPAPDNPYGLPNATQTGAGMFACLINGQKFIAGTLYNGDVSTNSAGFYNDTLGFSGTPKNSRYYQGISFTIPPPQQQNVNYLIDSINIIANYGSDSTCEGISFNIINSFSKSGTIKFTKIDKVNKIISGIFDNCIFPIPNCDTLYATNGRFDYHY